MYLQRKSVWLNYKTKKKRKGFLAMSSTFFNQLTVDGYFVSFRTQLSNKKVKQIIEDIMN